MAERLSRLTCIEPDLQVMDKLLSYACVKGLRGIYVFTYVQIGWYREYTFVPYMTEVFLLYEKAIY